MLAVPTAKNQALGSNNVCAESPMFRLPNLSLIPVCLTALARATAISSWFRNLALSGESGTKK